MDLPAELSRAIEEFTTGVASAELSLAAAELTASYRGERRSRPQLDGTHRAAYLITRLPATYAVLSRILRESKLRIPDLRVQSMLDLGAGPGTAMWAAATQFPELSSCALVEDREEWIAIGKRLATGSGRAAIRSADWRRESVAGGIPPGQFDMVTMSYLLNELRSVERLAIIHATWERTGKMLLIAEPGTPAGFEHIREVRRELIAAGAHMVAPCPHADACPMQGDNWCHFAERLQRNSQHRQAKNAELGFEDEKYSYVLFARRHVGLPAARVLRHPGKHSGHVEFELCTPEGLKRLTVSRKHGERYKLARKTEWGDVLD
jgi:ribosomal protein RSM22 (predicted rRNA methylase)